MSAKFADVANMTLYRTVDIPFIEACWDMINSSLEDNDAIRMHKGSFTPIFDDDAAINEVMIGWDVGGSTLKLCLAKELSIVHSQCLNDKVQFHLFKAEKLKEAMQRFTWLAPEIIDQYNFVIEKFISWGYEAHVSTGGNYPVPTVIFGKGDCLVKSVGMLEFTPPGLKSPVLN